MALTQALTYSIVTKDSLRMYVALFMLHPVPICVLVKGVEVSHSQPFFSLSLHQFQIKQILILDNLN